MKTYRYSFDDLGTYLLDNKGNRTDFDFEIRDGRPVFSLKIPEEEEIIEGVEPNAIIRKVNQDVRGVIIQPFDV